MAKRETVTFFEAPEGFVYDYKEPPIAAIKDKDGNVVEEPEHLYCKKLCLGSFDYIEHYILVKDPKGEIK